MTRKEFIGGAAGFAAMSVLQQASAQDIGGLRVRFLGTGAADWKGPDPVTGERRRRSSVLLDNRILIDFTQEAVEMLPKGVSPEVIFYTHSHDDHYSPLDALKLGIRRAYVNASWWKDATREFATAAHELGLAPPEVRPIAFGETKIENGITFTSLPANHVTNRKGEHCSMYLVEKGMTRLLYATDTSGIPGEAARCIGIDAQIRPGKAITALVMEATMGIGYEDDHRIYCHSSVATVAQTVRVLLKTKRYLPKPDQKVYLTHMARTLHGTQKEVAAAVPAPIAPAYDGLEVVF